MRLRVVACRAALVLFAGSILIITPVMPEPTALSAEESNVSVTLVQGYRPATIQIRTGDTVVWRNDDKADIAQYPVGRHQIRADDGTFQSGTLSPGASFSNTFLKPGTFAYKCVLHPKLMSGQVVATGPAITPTPKSQAVSIVERGAGDYGFEPKDIVIPVGATVTWRNNGTVVHTATADGLFDSGGLNPGDKFSFTFSKPVSLRYYCTPHKEFMSGTIRVAAAGAPPPPPPPAPQSNSGPIAVPNQSPRQGNAPATFTVLAVEPPGVANWGFSPPQLRIRAGDTVIWRNSGSATHTVTAAGGAFDTALAPGTTFSKTFDVPAKIAYACRPHPWMKGTITIMPASATGGSGAVKGGSDESDTQSPGAVTGTQSGSEKGRESAALRGRLGWGMSLAVILIVMLLVIPSLRPARRARKFTIPDDISELEESKEPAGVG